MTLLSRRPREVYRVYGEEDLEEHSSWPAADGAEVDPPAELSPETAEQAAADGERRARPEPWQIDRERRLHVLGVLVGGAAVGLLVGLVVLAGLKGLHGGSEPSGPIARRNVVARLAGRGEARSEPVRTGQVLLDGTRSSEAAPKPRPQAPIPTRQAQGRAEVPPSPVTDRAAPTGASVPRLDGPGHSQLRQAAAAVEFDFER